MHRNKTLASRPWLLLALLAVLGSPAMAQVTVSARTLDFGSVTNSATPVVKTWTITNSGRSNFQLPPYPTYQFKTVTSPATESGTFYVAGGDCSPGRVLKTKESCRYELAFQPRGFGDKSAIFTLSRSDFALPVTLTGKRLEPADYSRSGYGGSRTNPAKSVDDLVARRSSTSNDYYWFDPDGNGGRAPFLAYVEQRIDSKDGGWMLVRRIPSGKVWFPLNDDLRGAGWNTNQGGFVDEFAGTPLTPTTAKAAGLQFDYLLKADTQFMFAAVNSDGVPQLWCVIARGADGRFGGTSNASASLTSVVSYAGNKPDSTEPTKPSTTNVIFGAVPGSPWIGCEGSFVLNQNLMLYGEDGSTSYTSLLSSSAYHGINVYIRKIKSN